MVPKSKTKVGAKGSSESVPSETYVFPVDNNKCILVEFRNESNKIQTGFEAFLNKNIVKEIDDLIKNKKIVQVEWPNVEMMEAGLLKKHLINASTTKTSVRILARGTYIF